MPSSLIPCHSRMIIARILGTVVSTQKDERLSGKKLLIVKPINLDGTDQSGYIVAVDTVGAGFHEKVIIVGGSSARHGRREQGLPRRFRDHRRHRRDPVHQSRRLEMQIARVIGTVVATVKNESLHGRKFLIVQTLNADLKAKGSPMVALDAVGAGMGELVFWCRGKEASFPFKRDETPTDCTIVGIIDSDSHVFNP